VASISVDMLRQGTRQIKSCVFFVLKVGRASEDIIITLYSTKTNVSFSEIKYTLKANNNSIREVNKENF
jgi:hypothetical protein